MNYEEKYNEILEWARKNKARLNGVPIEEVLPELAESEDERIRKVIVKYFKELHVESWINLEIPNILAWLEKQKENPKSADSISSDCTSDAKCEDRWHKVTDSLPDNGRLVLAKDCLGNVLLARYDGENWEVNVYDNEDHYCHNSISKWCEIPSEKQKEQKPADYNEYKMLIEGARENGKIEGRKEVIDHPDEYGLTKQKPAEWSEEDEKYLNRVINLWVNDFGEDSDTVKWLKSLGPSWKPSEEQMKALQNAVALTACDKELVRLYNQLKKL